MAEMRRGDVVMISENEKVAVVSRVDFGISSGGPVTLEFEDGRTLGPFAQWMSVCVQDVPRIIIHEDGMNYHHTGEMVRLHTLGGNFR
jgi:hypothetical protein